jgi:hypothetical protein
MTKPLRTDPKGIAVAAWMCGAVSLYLLWLGVSDAPQFGGNAWVAYVGAALFAVLAWKTARRARLPATELGPPSIGERVATAVEATAYFIAALLGIQWLLARSSGDAAAPDDAQRAGLWVVAVISALIVVVAARAILRRYRRGGNSRV